MKGQIYITCAYVNSPKAHTHLQVPVDNWSLTMMKPRHSFAHITENSQHNRLREARVYPLIHLVDHRTFKEEIENQQTEQD
jgi:hypothetical protein